MIITIDGPTCSGKSTVAQLLAAQLGYYYINSGMLFRVIAYVLLQKGYTLEQLAGLTSQQLHAAVDMDSIRYVYQHGAVAVWYGADDVTAFLKGPGLDQAASVASACSCVRTLVLSLEHRLAKQHDIVIDGRDTGSVVFPQAQLKIFLTASLAVRAQRWIDMMQHKGQQFTIDQARHEITQRDERDSTRTIAPLCVPQGAVTLDSSALAVAAVVAAVKALYDSLCSTT